MSPGIGDVENGQQRLIGVAESQAPSRRSDRDQRLRRVEGNGDGPQGPVRQPHGLADTGIILRTQETPQRREPAAGQQFQVTELAAGEAPARPAGRTPGEFGSSVRRHEQVDKLSVVRWPSGGDGQNPSFANTSSARSRRSGGKPGPARRSPGILRRPAGRAPGARPGPAGPIARPTRPWTALAPATGSTPRGSGPDAGPATRLPRGADQR